MKYLRVLAVLAFLVIVQTTLLPRPFPGCLCLRLFYIWLSCLRLPYFADSGIMVRPGQDVCGEGRSLDQTMFAITSPWPSFGNWDVLDNASGLPVLVRINSYSPLKLEMPAFVYYILQCRLLIHL